MPLSMTETQIDIDWSRKEGIKDAEIGCNPEVVRLVTEIKKQEEGPLAAMAYYDGYIRHKYGLVDSEGFEV